MILNIILFSVCIILILLAILYLACIVSPLVSKQTKIQEHFMFARIEHNFPKLNSVLSENDETQNTYDEKNISKTENAEKKDSGLNKKYFKLWKQCYKMFFEK